MYTIGISGGSASGKSTFADLLLKRITAEGYKTALFSSDAYFRRPLPTMLSPVTGVVGPDYNSVGSVDFDALNADVDAARADASNDAVVVEGVFIFCCPELRERLDLKIFIDLPSDLRMYRRIKRNMAQRGLSMEEIADYYTEYAHFSEEKNSLPSKIYADVILNGLNFQNAATDMLTLYVKEQIKIRK